MIKRYTPDCSIHMTHEMAFMREADGGEYVKYSDHQQLLDAVVAERDAVVVENAGFKHALSVILEHVDVTDKGQAGVVAMIAELEKSQQRIAELESKLATPVRLPDEFARLGENLRTQDNRVTSEPMFCVYQKREIVTHADYDHDRIVWIDDDGVEANERQRMRLELLHDSCREVPDKWSRIAVKEIDEFVTCCFTEQGCKDYLACNGHNLRLPFIYVKSGFRNAEYIAIRNWLMTTGFKVEGDA